MIPTTVQTSCWRFLVAAASYESPPPSYFAYVVDSWRSGRATVVHLQFCRCIFPVYPDIADIARDARSASSSCAFLPDSPVALVDHVVSLGVVAVMRRKQLDIAEGSESRTAVVTFFRLAVHSEFAMRDVMPCRVNRSRGPGSDDAATRRAFRLTRRGDLLWFAWC